MTILNTTSGSQINRRKVKKCVKNVCSIKTVKKRLPIVEWLPKYNITLLFQDIIAGITVGLTAIPQGIAYAIVAGLPPAYGLYAGLMGGFVYLFFGSCKDVTIGPTAILSAMTAKYVTSYSADYAVLVAFLSGCIILVMGVLNLGFLVEFISIPVISAFTNAAALQIASAQLIPLFGLNGKSGNYFAQSIYNLSQNITTFRFRDTILGMVTIIIIVLLKRLGAGCGRTDGLLKRIRWFISLGRNAIVVVIGIIVAYVIKVTTDREPLKIIGNIASGLPILQLPPFHTDVGNETHTFTVMLQNLGPKSITLPLVSILESVAIAKAFADGGQVDATQEMVALGLCNIIGSFALSMPVTGSFTRTALNNASGVQTPAGGIFTGLLIILALSLLTSTFYYIPKASLAALIITAMYYMFDFNIFGRLWKSSKREFIVLVLTICVCLSFGLEYGIVAGIIMDATFLLFATARPKIEITKVNSVKGNVVILSLPESLAYCAADHVRRNILNSLIEADYDSLIIVDGMNLQTMDSTVASNLMSVIKDVDKKGVQILFLNFNDCLKKLCTDVNCRHENKFLTAFNKNIDDIVEVTFKGSNS